MALNGRPTICSLTSPWSDQNHGTSRNGSGRPSSVFAAVFAWSTAFCTDSSRTRRPRCQWWNDDAIADRDDLGRAGRHRRIDGDAVVDGDAGRLGELDIGDDADADQDEIGGDPVARGGVDGDDAAVLAEDAADRRAEADIGAPATMKVEEMARDFRRDDPAHQAVGGFEHGDGLAEEPRRRRHFEADEAAADHHDIVCRSSRWRRVRAWAASRSTSTPSRPIPSIGGRRGAGAGGKRQAVEGEGGPVGEAEGAFATVDRRRLGGADQTMAFLS